MLDTGDIGLVVHKLNTKGIFSMDIRFIPSNHGGRRSIAGTAQHSVRSP